MVAVKLLNSISGTIMFGNILSIKVLEWLVIPVNCKIKSIYERGKRI